MAQRRALQHFLRPAVGDGLAPQALRTSGEPVKDARPLNPLRDHLQPSSTLHHTAVLSTRPGTDATAAQTCPIPAEDDQSASSSSGARWEVVGNPVRDPEKGRGP